MNVGSQLHARRNSFQQNLVLYWVTLLIHHNINNLGKGWLTRAGSGPMQCQNLHRSYILEWSIGSMVLPCRQFTLRSAGRAHPLATIEALPFLCWRSYPSMYQYSHEALLYRFRYRAYCWNCCRLARPHCLTMVVISRRSLLSSYSFYFNCSHSVCCCHLVVLILSLTDP